MSGACPKSAAATAYRTNQFRSLASQEEIRFTVCAIKARNARRHTFTNQDVSVDALLASACLPQLFPALEIDGEHIGTVVLR